MVKSPSGSDHAGVGFHPPVLLLGLVFAGGFLSRQAPLPFLPPGPARPAGVALFVAAVGLGVWAGVTMHRGGASVPTNSSTDAIVRSGPYAFSRNPIYTAMVLLLISLSLWGNTLWFLVMAPLCAVLLYWGVISREEAYLSRKFGAEYESYKEAVRRWL